MCTGIRTAFTFHDVSINTALHQCLRLRIFRFTFHDVSINTLFSVCNFNSYGVFTFHDVSINTDFLSIILSGSPASLHSTMFLLIPVVYSSLQYRYNLTTFCQSCHFIIFILIFIFLDSSHF